MKLLNTQNIGRLYWLIVKTRTCAYNETYNNLLLPGVYYFSEILYEPKQQRLCYDLKLFSRSATIQPAWPKIFLSRKRID